MLRIKNVNKSYKGKVIALKDINLSVDRGEFAMILGLSGAGKSTLIKSINGLNPVDSGEIEFEGKSTLKKENIVKIRSDIGIIFQNFNIIKRLTVLENVLCGRLSHNNTILSSLRIFKKKDIDWAIECIEKVGLKDKIYSRSDQLSGGQQQRVGIARALAQKPKLILADEPVASLDPHSASEILDLLKDINERDNITMLMSLHNIELAEKYGKRIIGIKDGMVVFDRELNNLKKGDIEKIYTINVSNIKNIEK